VLFIPAFIVWQWIGGIVGLFVGALILFLFRPLVAGLLQMGLTRLGEFKELLPVAGAVLLIIAGIVPWSFRGGGLHYTVRHGGTYETLPGLSKAPETRLELIVRERSGKVVHTQSMNSPASGRTTGRVSQGGVEIMTYEVRNGVVREVVYKGVKLREKKDPGVK
jgi:hypothetical protein